MSSLEKLGSSLMDAIRKIMRAPILDEATVKELVKDIQRSLLQADVNVQLVLDISTRIQDRSLRDKLPQGISRREHVIKVVYEELTRFLGETPATIRTDLSRTNVLMLVGIQGSGKTTSAAKLARYFQKRGLKAALVCADTYRPGAYAQLKQLADRINVPIYGDPEERDAIKLAVRGVERFKGERLGVVILDTAGRHKDEKNLIQEMVRTARAVDPDEVILTIDATIGQQAAVQARAFNEATKIGSIFLTKLDGSARGGGALSAVAATGAPIVFIGTGEGVDEIEDFVPSRFVGRLLGMGDLEGLIQRVREAEVAVPEEKIKDFLSGKFSLTDVYQQMEAVRSMGPLRHVMKMIPGMGYSLPDEAFETAEDKMKRWRYAIQSMTKEEREDPRVFNASRYRRVARGSGTSEGEVRELVKTYFKMKKLVKRMRKGRLPRQLMRKLPKELR